MASAVQASSAAVAAGASGASASCCRRPAARSSSTSFFSSAGRLFYLDDNNQVKELRFDGQASLGTSLLGIGGSLVVGLISSWSTGETVGQGFSRAGCLGSIVGAMVLIFSGRQLGWHF